MFKKHLNKFQLMKHIAKLRRKNTYWRASKACQSSKTTNYAEWRCVDAQAVQEISDRMDKSYKLFFKHYKTGVRPPSFCKSKKYKSFTLKQTGYKLLNGKIRIGKKVYGYHNSREVEGKIKTVTVKRMPTGDVYIFIVTDFVTESIGVVTGKIAGFECDSFRRNLEIGRIPNFC